jgi:hypothetical protein
MPTSLWTCLVAMVIALTAAPVPRSVVENAPPFLGFSEFDFPDFSGGNHHRHDFEHLSEDGKRATLQYETELAEDTYFLHLDRDATVTAVNCSSLFLTPDHGRLTVFLTAQGAHDLQTTKASQSMVTGSMHWGCRNLEAKPTGVLHKILRTVEDNRQAGVHQITFEVERAAYQHVFKHASVKFYTNRFPEKFLTVHDHSHESVDEATQRGHYTIQKPAALSSPRPQRNLLHKTVSTTKPEVPRWGFSSFLSTVWNTVKTVGSVVQAAVETVVVVTRVITTGSVDSQNTFAANSWSYNVDSSNRIINPQVPIDNYVTCVNCGLTAQFGIVFELVITNYRLVTLRAVAEGSFSGVAGVDGQWSAEYTRSVNRQLSQTHIPGISFFLGPLPATITLDVLINAGYELEVQASAVVAANVAVYGSFEFGVGFSQGNMYMISEQDFAYSGGITKINGNAATGIKIFLLPSMQMQVLYVGGPNVGIEPFVEVNAEVSTNRFDPCFAVGGVKLSTAAGLQATVGASLNITAMGVSLWSRDFGSTAVYSGKWPILSGVCFSISKAEANSLVDDSTSSSRALVVNWNQSHGGWDWDASMTGNTDTQRAPSLTGLLGPQKPVRVPQSYTELRGEMDPRQQQPVLQFSPYHGNTSEALESAAVSVKDQRGRHPMDGSRSRPELSFTVTAGGVVDVGCAAGATWEGRMTRGPGTSSRCALYPPLRDVSIQVLETTVTAGGPIMDVMLSISDANSIAASGQTFACTFQQMWTLNVFSQSESTTLGFERQNDNQAFSSCSGDLEDSSCTCANSQTTIPTGIYGFTDPDLEIITLEDSLRCTQIILHRIQKGTTGHYYQQTAAYTNVTHALLSSSAEGLTSTAEACGMGSGPAPGECCGGLPADQCNLARGSSCMFGCQCTSGSCSLSTGCA